MIWTFRGNVFSEHMTREGYWDDLKP